MSHYIDMLHDWLMQLGNLGVVLWIVLKILAIAVPVIRPTAIGISGM